MARAMYSEGKIFDLIGSLGYDLKIFYSSGNITFIFILVTAEMDQILRVS